MDLFGKIFKSDTANPEENQQIHINDNLNTLEEPVWVTILRDLASVGMKIGHVIFPFWGTFKRVNKLQDWDLWGPFIISFVLASILTLAAENQEALIFTSVFVIVWIGSAIITINAILLGGKVSFFQTVCALGYCLAPLAVAAFICLFFEHLAIRLAVVGACWGWSVFCKFSLPLKKSSISIPTYALHLPRLYSFFLSNNLASWGFIMAMMPREKLGRNALVLYPVFLFYLVLAWMVVVLHDVADVD